MMNVEKIIKDNVISVVKELYNLDVDAVFIEHPANEEWGDYATNVSMVIAKKLEQSPQEIAKKLSYKLDSLFITHTFRGKKYPIFESVTSAGIGFVNFKLSEEWLHIILNNIGELGDDYGTGSVGCQKRIALEHSNVNPNKAAHVGHLRNAAIGQFLERVYEVLGYVVEVQYYDNDLGVQVTTSLMGTQRVKDILPGDYKKFDHYAWDVYAKMEQLIAKDPTLEHVRQKMVARLEDESDPISVEQVELSKKILVEQLKTFQKLGFDYDVVIRERDVVSLGFWQAAFELLKQNENVYLAEEGPSKGCWLVRMGGNDSKTKEGIEADKIIVRSNGVPTYTGKDIAYHMWKFGLLHKDFGYARFDVNTQDKPLWITTSKQTKADVSFTDAHKVFNVIDVKQTYAMEAVRKSLEYLGYAREATDMVHINYGFVYLSPDTAKAMGIDISDGRSKYAMSGRKGWGVKIDDFIDMVDSNLNREHGDFEALYKVRNSAIKFEMLKSNTFQDMIFDLDTALDIKGYSGPYLQYAYVRAQSVLQKAGDWTFEFSMDSVTSIGAKEAAILRYLYRFPEVVKRSASEFAPNLMCEYLFELAQRFNSFYASEPILSAKDTKTREFRLKLASCVAQVLKSGLYLLGIEVVDRM